MAKSMDLPGIYTFDIHCEQSQQGTLWKRWLRSFELYAEGRGVTKYDQKRSLLLHCAGLDVQDIFFTLEEANGTNNYEKAVNTLNNYFVTKVNVPYERYQFRALKQSDTETVEQYISRLRQKATMCEFENADEQIRDQVIEKCKSTKLRTKLLEQGHDLKLNDLCTIASTMELAEKQSRQIEENTAARNVDTVNRVGTGARPKVSQQKNPRTYRATRNDADTEHRYTQQISCYRCGRSGHRSADANCPARNKKCDRCRLVGHFKKCCKTQLKKYENRQESNKRQDYHHKKGQGHVNTVDFEHRDNEYTFILGTKSEKATLSLNNIDVDFIID